MSSKRKAVHAVQLRQNEQVKRKRDVVCITTGSLYVTIVVNGRHVPFEFVGWRLRPPGAVVVKIVGSKRGAVLDAGAYRRILQSLALANRICLVFEERPYDPADRLTQLLYELAPHVPYMVAVCKPPGCKAIFYNTWKEKLKGLQSFYVATVAPVAPVATTDVHSAVLAECDYLYDLDALTPSLQKIVHTTSAKLTPPTRTPGATCGSSRTSVAASCGWR